jgi:hypothetical protein
MRCCWRVKASTAKHKRTREIDEGFESVWQVEVPTAHHRAEIIAAFEQIQEAIDLASINSCGLQPLPPATHVVIARLDRRH